MIIHLSAYEIGEEIAKMKPSKSPGCDEISIELIKYSPKTIHEQIAEI